MRYGGASPETETRADQTIRPRSAFHIPREKTSSLTLPEDSLDLFESFQLGCSLVLLVLVVDHLLDFLQFTSEVVLSPITYTAL